MNQLHQNCVRAKFERRLTNAIKKAEQLLVPGSTHNHIWKHI